MHNDLWLIPFLPLAAAVVVGLFGKLLRGAGEWLVVAACAASCVVAIKALIALYGISAGSTLESSVVQWFAVGGVNASAQLIVDPITAVMLAAITFIGTWIAIYSVGYMHGDPGAPRYFAVFSGFVFSMCGLVLSQNLLVIYAFWEGVGLCSYLLIGFWFARPAAAAAARKAFLVTRIGDAGFILGIFLLWSQFGSVDLTTLFQKVRSQPNESVLTMACLLLFCGAVGKSAQFPLHVWLPDAMEGPTPASALIHAATMVTAGVYLVARCMPLFVLAPFALAVVSAIGAFTALLAALIALTQNDLKRVMAYSTVSQLAFMFSALGCGQGQLASFAVTAAIFHLFTHAFFKALLFLASGSVMHAMGGIIDMRRFSGLRKAMPITHITFACGAFALAGLPPFAGFWSKDEILAVDWEASHFGNYHAFYFVVFVVLLIAALLTAFYTSRAYFRTFWGELKVPDEAGSHDHGDSHDHHAPGEAHESPSVMTIPLIVLAIGAVSVGLILSWHHLFANFLAKSPNVTLYLGHHEHELNFPLMAVSSAIALAGIVTAWFMYVKRPELPGKLANRFPTLYRASLNRFYFDEIYGWIAEGPLVVLAIISRIFDLLIDGIVDFVGRMPKVIGGLLRPIQNGLVQFYALAMILGLTVFLGILAFRR